MKLNANHLTILTEARRSIESSQHREFICNAIDLVAKENPALVKSAKTLTSRIQFLISPTKEFTTLETWLVRQGIDGEQAMNHKYMKAYRLRWIDHMLETKTL